MKYTNMAFLGLLLSACLFCGCGKPGSSKRISYETSQQARLDWNTKTLISAYQNVGDTDPVWDKTALQALMEFARVRTQAVTPDEPLTEIIVSNSFAAMKAGC